MSTLTMSMFSAMNGAKQFLINKFPKVIADNIGEYVHPYFLDNRDCASYAALQLLDKTRHSLERKLMTFHEFIGGVTTTDFINKIYGLQKNSPINVFMHYVGDFPNEGWHYVHCRSHQVRLMSSYNPEYKDFHLYFRDEHVFTRDDGLPLEPVGLVLHGGTDLDKVTIGCGMIGCRLGQLGICRLHMSFKPHPTLRQHVESIIETKKELTYTQDFYRVFNKKLESKHKFVSPNNSGDIISAYNSRKTSDDNEAVTQFELNSLIVLAIRKLYDSKVYCSNRYFILERMTNAKKKAAYACIAYVHKHFGFRMPPGLRIDPHRNCYKAKEKFLKTILSYLRYVREENGVLEILDARENQEKVKALIKENIDSRQKEMDKIHASRMAIYTRDYEIYESQVKKSAEIIDLSIEEVIRKFHDKWVTGNNEDYSSNRIVSSLKKPTMAAWIAKTEERTMAGRFKYYQNFAPPPKKYKKTFCKYIIQCFQHHEDFIADAVNMYKLSCKKPDKPVREVITKPSGDLSYSIILVNDEIKLEELLEQAAEKKKTHKLIYIKPKESPVDQRLVRIKYYHDRCRGIAEAAEGDKIYKHRCNLIRVRAAKNKKLVLKRRDKRLKKFRKKHGYINLVDKVGFTRKEEKLINYYIEENKLINDKAYKEQRDIIRKDPIVRSSLDSMRIFRDAQTITIKTLDPYYLTYFISCWIYGDKYVKKLRIHGPSVSFRKEMMRYLGNFCFLYA